MRKIMRTELLRALRANMKNIQINRFEKERDNEMK